MTKIRAYWWPAKNFGDTLTPPILELVVASSLHAVIVAEAYGVPVIWAKYTDKIVGGEMKFQDYFLGTGRTRQEYFKQTTPLSNDAFKETTGRLLEAFKKEYGE